MPAKEKKLPPDPEGMNDERAISADQTLDNFAQNHGELYPTQTDDERRQLEAQNLADLLSNFGHYCDRAGLTLADILTTAANHYNAETDNQGPQRFEANQ